MEARQKKTTQKMTLELKYCERCGGLWLRPGGGAQIYCAACGREVAELPRASRDVESKSGQREPRWIGDGGDFERDEEIAEVYLDERGGVA
jgi:Zn-finger nucleic acid-binding protein